MTEEHQPREIAGVPTTRAARRGAAAGVDEARVHRGPVASIDDAGRLIISLLAPRDAPPMAITTRLRDDTIDAVFQPTAHRGPRPEVVPWHYVMSLPVKPNTAPPRVRIVGLGTPVVIVAERG